MARLPRYIRYINCIIRGPLVPRVGVSCRGVACVALLDQVSVSTSPLYIPIVHSIQQLDCFVGDFYTNLAADVCVTAAIAMPQPTRNDNGRSPPGEGHIDAREFDRQRTVHTRTSRDRSLLDDDVSFMNELAQGIIDRDRRQMRREVTRIVSFAVAVLCW